MQNRVDNKSKTYPLTELQLAYYVGREESKDATRVLYEFRTMDKVDVMERALNRIIEEQAALQLVFTKDGRQKMVEDHPFYHIAVKDLRRESKEKAELIIKREFKKATKRNYDIYTWPLFSLQAYLLPGTEEIAYHFGIDMLIADAMSIRYIIRQIQQYCIKEEESKPVDMDFLEFCESKARREKNDSWKKARNYWMDQIDTFPEAPDFTPNTDREGRRKYQRKELEIASVDWTRIVGKIAKKGISPSSFLMGAYAYVVGIHSGKKNFAINLPVFGKMGDYKKDTVGDFSSIILVPISMEETDFYKFCKNVQISTMISLLNREFSGLEFTREIARYRGEQEILYPVVFTSLVNKQQRAYVDDRYRMIRGYSQTSQVILDCQVMATEDGQLNAFWDYDNYSFPDGLIENMFCMFENILKSAGSYVENVQKDIHSIWNEYESEHNWEGPSEGILGEELTSIAEIIPEKMAVTDGVESWSYRMLAEKTNIISEQLQKKGLKKGQGVMIPAVKSPAVFALILAVLRCGGYYVPILPDTPHKRREMMISLSGAEWDITLDECKEMVQQEKDPFYTFKQPVVKPKDRAYIIFTSGSTGVPKGVVISHGEAWNTIKDINNRFNVNKHDVILGISELTFDLSVYDLFGTIMSGASLVFAKDHHHMKEIISIMNRYHVSIWNSVPALFTLLLDTESNNVAYYKIPFGIDAERVRHTVMDNMSLRLVLLSGDYIPVTLPGRIRSSYPNSSVISLGGATEGSIWSIFYPIENVNEGWKTIPYGYPLSNQQIYIVDWKNDPVPPMTVGEICIGGKGVADGYAGNLEQTELSFVEHPLLGRIYKTGDFGMLSNQGYVEFLGRRDQQVKINGYRVELGEISRKVESCKNVEKTVVLRTGVKQNSLALFYSGSINANELRTILESELMHYMVPSVIQRIDSFPLTKNGKVDRKKLLAMADISREIKSPINEDEQDIFDAVKKILEIDVFSTDDNFFNLGADSMKIIELFNILDETYEVNLNQIFLYPSVSELAKVIRKKEVYDDWFEKTRKFFDDMDPSEEQEEQLNQLYDAYKLAVPKKTAQIKIGDNHYKGILLTGATGYLGAYMVRELYRQSDGLIHLIIRGEKPYQRLLSNLRFYFGDQFDESELEQRVVVWNGDITEENQGMTSDDDHRLWSMVDCVLHCAAKVAHYGKAEDFENINVNATRFLLEKCERYNVDFNFISSTTVLYDSRVDGCRLFTEDTTSDHFEARELYADSKIRCEKMIEKYREKGVSCKIYRVGAILHDSENGKFQKNMGDNAFYTIFKIFQQLKLFPEMDSKIIDITCVDDVSSSIVTLMLRVTEKNCNFHIFNPNRLSLTEFYGLLKKAGMPEDVRLLGEDEMMQVIANGDETEKKLMDLMVIHATSYVSEGAGASLMVCDKTAAILKRLGFEWRIPDEKLIRLMYQHGVEQEFWN